MPGAAGRHIAAKSIIRGRLPVAHALFGGCRVEGKYAVLSRGVAPGPAVSQRRSLFQQGRL